MTTWILILTLTTQDAYKIGQPNSTVESIQGFKTQSACMTAANAWIKQVSGFYYIKALCVADK